MKATITSGKHNGRTGSVVSVPWLLNLWNMRITVNVPANEEEIRVRYKEWGDRIGELLDEMKEGHGPREWVDVWRWQISLEKHESYTPRS